jgi:hypothetical protein
VQVQPETPWAVSPAGEVIVGVDKGWAHKAAGLEIRRYDKADKADIGVA